FYTPLSLLPVTFSLLPLSPSRDLGSCDPSPSKGRPATTGRADLRRWYLRVRLRVAVTTDRSTPGRPELAGKPCFPTEVPANPPELPARNSPSFLHQIDRASEVQPISMRKLQRAVEGRGIHHRANHSFRPRGDSAEFSAEV
ncbi:hypothetical protein Prudu_208S000500, partial [Prunus dulcis]